ncbi:hypothetical protein JMG10_49570, partial [Nostoc ellipsosporum NOK]|nr:hypothetical protein [Nostoc ellipsosporum NOK]
MAGIVLLLLWDAAEKRRFFAPRPRRAEEVGGVEAFGRSDLDDRLVAIVIFHPKRAGDHRMHVVKTGDVGEFEDLLVVPERPELVEHRGRHAPAGLRQAIGISEHRALLIVEAIGDRPMRYRGDLLVAYPQPAQRLAMLRKDELAALDPARAGLAEFAQHRIDRPRRVAIDREAVDRVLEDVGREREYRPPITRRAGRGTGLGDGIAIAEQAVVIIEHDLVGHLAARHLAQYGHDRSPRSGRREFAEFGDVRRIEIFVEPGDLAVLHPADDRAGQAHRAAVMHAIALQHMLLDEP